MASTPQTPIQDSTFLPDIVEHHEEEDDRTSICSSMNISYYTSSCTHSGTTQSRTHSGITQHYDHRHIAESEGVTTLHSSLSNVEDEEEYDTDIEINEDELFHEKKKVSEDESGVGAGEYKRSCTRLNISPDTKIVENLGSTTLNLAFQGLGEDGAKALAKSLIKNTKVEKLKLEDNSITPLGVTFLVDMLCDNIYITYMDLSHNDVGTFGSLAFKEMLINNSTLLTLILKGCKIKDSDCVVLAEGVQRNESLVYLDLSHNEICEEGAMCLGNAIAINNSLEQLSLAWNHIRRNGAVTICRALKRNYCLVKVDLSWNGLGYEGGLALGQALKTNKHIREMDISSNRLTWKCASVIAAGLRDNYTLEVFKVGLNPLTMTGVLELLSAVNNQHSEMEYMSFEGVPINRKIAYIAETLSDVREFSIEHGGVIDTDDVMGRRPIAEDDPLSRLMAFLNDRGIRAVDLFRSLEKDKDQLVSREQFISGLKKAQVPLETWEMVKVMEKLDKAELGRINYRKLNEGIHEQKVVNTKKENKAKSDAIRKRSEERKLLNPEQSVSRANSAVPRTSSGGSLASVPNSRRSSRVSLNISQGLLDMRRSSAVSAISLRSSAISPKPGGTGRVTSRSVLAAAVSSRQKGVREGEMMRKLSRLSLPSSSSRTVSPTPKIADSKLGSRTMSLVS